MLTVQESNKAAFMSIMDASNSHDQELISQTVAEVFAPDARMGSSVPIQETGAQAVNAIYATLHRAFPDLHIAVEDLVAEGDKVVARHKVTGTHQGEYLGIPPTGVFVTYEEMFVFRFEAGRIVEVWGVVDALSQLRQLGAIDGPR